VGRRLRNQLPLALPVSLLDRHSNLDWLKDPLGPLACLKQVATKVSWDFTVADRSDEDLCGKEAASSAPSPSSASH